MLQLPIFVLSVQSKTMQQNCLETNNEMLSVPLHNTTFSALQHREESCEKHTNTHTHLTSWEPVLFRDFWIEIPPP